MQITTGENKRYSLSGLGGSWSPDGSRLLIESQNGQTSRNDVLIAKLSGYDSIKQGFRAANKSMIIQASNEQPSPELTLTATPQIAESITTTPRVPGFDAALAIGILYTIYLFKRRYN